MPPEPGGPLDWGPLDANISMLFTELPLLARPAAARAAGFTAVEAWWPFGSAVPADAEVDRVRARGTRCGCPARRAERVRRRHARG